MKKQKQFKSVKYLSALEHEKCDRGQINEERKRGVSVAPPRGALLEKVPFAGGNMQRCEECSKQQDQKALRGEHAWRQDWQGHLNG